MSSGQLRIHFCTARIRDAQVVTFTSYRSALLLVPFNNLFFHCSVGGVSLAFKLRGLTAENFGRLLAAVFAAVQVYYICRFYLNLNCFLFFIKCRLCIMRVLFLIVMVSGGRSPDWCVLQEFGLSLRRLLEGCKEDMQQKLWQQHLHLELLQQLLLRLHRKEPWVLSLRFPGTHLQLTMHLQGQAPYRHLICRSNSGIAASMRLFCYDVCSKRCSDI